MQESLPSVMKRPKESLVLLKFLLSVFKRFIHMNYFKEQFLTQPRFTSQHSRFVEVKWMPSINTMTKNNPRRFYLDDNSRGQISGSSNHVDVRAIITFHFINNVCSIPQPFVFEKNSPILTRAYKHTQRLSISESRKLSLLLRRWTKESYNMCWTEPQPQPELECQPALEQLRPGNLPVGRRGPSHWLPQTTDDSTA